MFSFPVGKGTGNHLNFPPFFEMGLDCAEIRRKSKKGKENFLPIPRPDPPPDPYPSACPLMSRPANTYYSHSLHESGAERGRRREWNRQTQRAVPASSPLPPAVIP